MLSDHLHSESIAALRRDLQQLARQIIFGTLAERGRVRGKPPVTVGGAPSIPPCSSPTGGDGKANSTHVPSAVVDTVRAGIDAWHRFQAVAR